MSNTCGLPKNPQTEISCQATDIFSYKIIRLEQILNELSGFQLHTEILICIMGTYKHIFLQFCHTTINHIPPHNMLFCTSLLFEEQQQQKVPFLHKKI